MQVVGRSCALCGERIATTAQGGFCPACGAAVHARCVRRGPKPPEACPTCGAFAGDVRSAAPPVPQEPAPRLASHSEVRLFGGFAICLGLGIAAFVKGVPAPWLGYFAIAVGIGMLAMPSLFRAHVARVADQETVWTPPEPRGSPGSPDVTFEGAYEMPTFTAGDRPFPIRGWGRLAVRGNGIEATGPAVAVLSPLTSILIATAVSMIAVTAVGLTFATDRAVWLALLAGIPLACIPLLRKWSRKPVTVAIPWENVHGFRMDPKHSAIRILVRRMRPSGEIIFVPKAGAEPLVTALLDSG